MSTASADAASPSVRPLPRKVLYFAGLIAFAAALLQSPGRTAADTKFDLAENPAGFLGRAAHLWNSTAPMGQVQNQAYGYFFPHGAFFALTHAVHIPAWIAQRAWWAIVVVVGFWGVVRLAEALRIGSRTSRVLAGIAYALAPRVLITIGTISSESLPVMLAPWVLLPVVLALERTDPPNLRRLAAASAGAVALMGAVNAVATLAAVAPAGLWWLLHRPGRRWIRFSAWWIPLLAVATAWWVVPLLILGKVSPPFLDYIESAGVTTGWTSPAEVLRGVSSWTPFVSPERVSGAVLVSQPAAVLATGVVAVAGLTGLALRTTPGRGRLVVLLSIGIVGMSIAHVGGLSSPVAESARAFLDGAGAPLRNVHKLEPLVRLPLVLGLAALLARAPLPGSVPRARWTQALEHPERHRSVAIAAVVLAALATATSVAWSGKLAAPASYRAVPGYWQEAADWLGEHSGGGRTLVVPAAPFALQTWGMTRDEPLQALAETPWAVRDVVPLTPPATVRAMDAVEQLFADGRPSPALATVLAQQGFSTVLLRNDLDPLSSHATRSILVRQSIEGSPGFTAAAQFGEPVTADLPDDVIADGGLRPDFPAIEVFSIDPASAGPSTPYTVDLDATTRVAGGPEALLTAQDALSLAPGQTALLASDAEAAGLPSAPALVTDTPRDREVDFGQVDNHASSLRAADEPRHTLGAAPDYATPDTPRVSGVWSGGALTVSSSAGDATALGGAAPGSGPAAAIDGDPRTAWVSSLDHGAVGQSLRVDLDAPIQGGMLHLRTAAMALGSPVKLIEVRTERGTTTAKVSEPGEQFDVPLPGGQTGWVSIRAVRTENGSSGGQFGIAELSIDSLDRQPIPLRFSTVLPEQPQTPAGWLLTQQFPGRSNCAVGSDPEGQGSLTRCSTSFASGAEEPGRFQRTLSTPSAVDGLTPTLRVRARAGADLDALLDDPFRISAEGTSDGADPRGTAAALTDGDSGTSWTAPASSLSPAGPLPTVTLHLREAQEVSSLQLVAPRSQGAARATEVVVDLGSGPQVRAVDWSDDGTATVDLHGARTDTVVLSVAGREELTNATIFGTTEPVRAGFAEVVPLLPDGQPVPGAGLVSPAPREQQVVTVGCDVGPTVRVGDQLLRTSVTATAAQLLRGDAVPALFCDPASTAVAVPGGQTDVEVDPGPAFSVADLRLDSAPPAAAAAQTSVEVSGWSADSRSVELPGSAEQRVLVVPESENPGWEAVADGTKLTEITVNGWQQGWVVPAGFSGAVALTYPLDGPYRVGLFGGLAALVLIPLIAAPRARSRESSVPARPLSSRALGITATVMMGFLLGGWIGLATAVVAVAVWIGLRQSPPGLSAAIVAASAGTSFALLSLGPWRSANGYFGERWWVQLPLLIALVALGLSAVRRPPAPQEQSGGSPSSPGSPASPTD